MRVLRYLYSHSIWHPEALDPEEFKYRHLKRMWLPLFDLLSILVGALAFAYGSTVLNSLYPREFISAVAIGFTVASFVALVGVSFPALWVPEVLGKLVIMTLLGSYSVSIWASFLHGNVESGFVAAVLMYPILFPLFRLQLLGEEVKQRRVDRDE